MSEPMTDMNASSREIRLLREENEQARELLRRIVTGLSQEGVRRMPMTVAEIRAFLDGEEKCTHEK